MTHISFGDGGPKEWKLHQKPVVWEAVTYWGDIHDKLPFG